jgi:hypothetical protein
MQLPADNMRQYQIEADKKYILVFNGCDRLMADQAEDLVAMLEHWLKSDEHFFVLALYGGTVTLEKVE